VQFENACAMESMNIYTKDAASDTVMLNVQDAEVALTNPFKEAYLWMKREHLDAIGMIDCLGSIDQLSKALAQKYTKLEKKKEGKGGGVLKMIKK